MNSYIFSFIIHKFWKMLFIVNVFADRVCVVFASPLTVLFALLCEHVSKTPEMFACSQIICEIRHACCHMSDVSCAVSRSEILIISKRAPRGARATLKSMMN